MTLALAAIATLLVTSVLTIAGVGGAFLLIPIYTELGVDLHVAMATALLLNTLSTSTASVRLAKAKLIPWRIAVPALVTATLASPFGAAASHSLPENTLKAFFIAFLLFAAASLSFLRPTPRSEGRVQLGAAVIGVVAGFLGGLLGVGGGLVLSPALILLGVEPKRASAASTFVVIFSSLSGFLGHAGLKGMDLSLLGVTAGASLGGSLLASGLLAGKMNGARIKPLLVAALLLAAGRMTWKLIG